MVSKVPLFLIERSFAEKLDLDSMETDGLNEVNDEENVSWVYSFLSADQKKTICLYEAESAEALRRAAEKAGIPAGAIVEVHDQLMPDGSVRTIPIG